jgi:hypothetical protein
VAAGGASGGAAHRSGIAIDAIGPGAGDIATPFAEVIDRPRQVLVLPRGQLVAA